jgi:hypothetical protein
LSFYTKEHKFIFWKNHLKLVALDENLYGDFSINSKKNYVFKSMAYQDCHFERK